MLPQLASAQVAGYPNRPIKLLVPWAVGGATDSLSRIIAQKLGARLKQTVVVDNKGGAGGTIGTSAFVKEKADGYSLLMATSSTNAAGPYLYSRLGFDPVRDFSPIAYVGLIPNVLEVSKKSHFNTAKELIDEARRKPGTLNYGSGGPGSSQHLAGSLLQRVATINVVHVPYKGSGPAIADLMAGQLDFVLDTGSLAQVKAGSLKALAVASEKRLPALPDVPTFAELGYKGMLASAWYGILAPANLPKPVQELLNREVNAVLEDPEVRQLMEQNLGAVVSPGHTPAWFANFMKSELAKYAEIVRISGAKME
ncbi:Bug family tripartite tricarboxylate transporter substrate binding protein [Cupriavidus sp. PET2-C1]